MRLVVLLPPPLGEALAKMAYEDIRHPREQMQFLIRQEAERRGLIRLAEREPRCQEEKGEQAAA